MYKRENKNTKGYGSGGRTGGNIKYDQMKIDNNFKKINPTGLNRHKPNITTDKPFDSHI